ncbi:DNA integrity scanning protein DisA nucleotide-binding domain protein [Methanohalophilus profundi]|uniref:DNA integrity scanning protein DisA nucleotide-binding domain protein n=1 Tax=Methanohalophilus profundi TaxID=2138083 RepID=UPI00101BB375|nr:diadenylate cyclase [Methanohalophilus profundi]
MDTADILVKSALETATQIKASAIIVSGEVDRNLFCCDIPVYFAANPSRSAVESLIPLDEEEGRLKQIVNQIQRDTAVSIEDVENAAAIEQAVGNIKKGNVVGLVITDDSGAVIVHNISGNPLLKALEKFEQRVSPEVIRAVLKIALEIAYTGREGSPVGTAFIIGDLEEVMQRSHQMILNPYSGHPEDERNILKKNNRESIKEFALLDGVFIISKEGVVHAAGRYLDVDAKDIGINKGLGGRHVSAAAITRDTVAVAITVSESGGTVRMFMDGKEMASIECNDRAIRKH